MLEYTETNTSSCSMKPKAYSYIRFSSPEQSRGDSQRRQREAATKYAEEHDLELVLDKDYQFFDAGISAYKGRNATHEGKLRRFYDYVRDGRIESGSYLLVESLDRLSREDVLVALPRFIDLLNEGVNVVTLSDKTVYTKGADVPQLIMSIVHMARAHHESKLKGDRVSKAWREKQLKARQESKPLGRVCPYWLDYIEGEYVINEERAGVVRKIFELTIAGYGQIAIAKSLNQNGTSVFGSRSRNKSGLWGTSSIAKILSNRSVLGEYQPMIHEGNKRINSGPPIEGYYPSVITEEEFFSALYMRTQRRVYKDTKRSKDYNIWSKLVVCSKCRSPMHLVNKGEKPKGQKYLRCFSSAKGMCDAKSIRLNVADVAFKEILAMFNSLPLVKESKKTAKKKVVELNGRIESIRKLLDQYQSLLESAPSAALSRAAASKELELEECVAEAEKIQSDMAGSAIFDKQGFLSQLDLESYEGRSAANMYLRNLDVQIRAGNNGLECFFVAVLMEPKKLPIPQFAIWVTPDMGVRITPLSREMTVNVINQGELDSARMTETLKRALPELLAQTEGNGRQAVHTSLEDIPTVKWRTEKERHLDLLLDSVGLKAK